MLVNNSNSRPPELEEYQSYGTLREKITWHTLAALPWIAAAFGVGYYVALWTGVCK